MASVKVIEKNWKVLVRSDRWLEKAYPETHAIAILDDRKIYVRRSSLNAETLIHELVHAYQYELSFYELQLDDDQIEEWYAELISKFGQRMIDDAKRLVNILSK
jgi:hypothetical protein